MLTVTNTNTLSLLNILNRNSLAQSETIRQLTTGKRINEGKDDPAGLIALSLMNAELTAVNSALSDNQRTDSFLKVADTAIGEISSLLLDIERLVSASTSKGNLSDSEIAANQAQIDSSLTAIDRIVNNTSFNGKKILDGTISIQTAGVSDQYIENLRVFSRSESTSDTTMTITRVASAQVASAALAFAGGAARTSGTSTVSIQGALGTATLTFTSGLTQTQIVSQINAAKDQTGVSAIQNSTNIKLNSATYGKDSFVSVEVLSGGTINSSYGTATSDGNTTNDIKNVTKQLGKDATITINGQTTGTDGLDVFYNGGGASLSFTLDTEFGRGNTGATTTSTFTVKASGGATFQLGTNPSTRSTIGINPLAVAYLGGGNGSKKLSDLKSGGTADLRTDVASALVSVKEAIREVAESRGRVGGFQKYEVGSAIRTMQAMQVGLSSAASVIGDTDFAVATANLNQQNVLVQASISLLGVVNQQSASILQLLR